MPLFAVMAVIVFTDPKMIALVGVVRQVIGFSLTLGLWRFYRRWPAADFKLAAHAWQIVLACVLATLLDALIAEGLRLLLRIPAAPDIAHLGSIVLRCAVYLVWSALYFAIRQEIERHDTELRLARAEAANREAELLLLRAQVNPHFLLNALNTIIGEAEHNPAAVIHTTHAVADYLRYSLGQREHRAPLGDELDAMANYLLVEAVHHRSHGLDWKIVASDEARRALAPTALVQPLVENALKYGFRTSPKPLRLSVTARIEAGLLLVAVENSGDWIEREGAAGESTGIGLNNVRRRLALLCGERAALEVTRPPGAVRIAIRLPLEPLSA